MNTIELKEGEVIKVIGQKDTFLIITNLDGEIFTKESYDRES